MGGVSGDGEVAGRGCDHEGGPGWGDHVDQADFL